MMQSLAYSILKDHQLSEDAVQEALIRLSQNKEKIGNINSRETKSYIYTVTKNEALRLAEKEINKNQLIPGLPATFRRNWLYIEQRV